MAAGCILFASGAAQAESSSLEMARPDEPSVASAFVTGAVLAGVSLGIGGAIAVGADSDAARATGVYAAQAGLIVSPFVAHAMLGETQRGVVYSLTPLAAMFGMAAVLQARPHTVAGGPAPYQYAFSTFMTMSVFSAMLGVSDVLSFHDRTGKSSVAVLPEVGVERIGIRIGGKL